MKNSFCFKTKPICHNSSSDRSGDQPMITKLGTVLFMIFVSFFAHADKLYKKDVAECLFNEQKIIFELKSDERYTSSEDDDYGHMLQIRASGKDQNVNLAKEYPGRQRFVSGRDSFCGNALALKIDDEQFALFFGRDNRPFADSITVLYYNIKTHSVEILISKIQALTAFVFDGSAYFQHSSSGNFPVSKTQDIEGKKFNVTEKKFQPWISFDGRNFQLDRTMSYHRFEYKSFIKESDLDQLSEFKDLTYSHATSMNGKKKCFSLNKANWNCL